MVEQFPLWVGGWFQLRADCILGLIEEQSLLRKSSLENWLDWLLFGFSATWPFVQFVYKLYFLRPNYVQHIEMMLQPSCISGFVVWLWRVTQEHKKGSEGYNIGWLTWHHLILQNSWRAPVQIWQFCPAFLWGWWIMDMDIFIWIGSRIELDWRLQVLF